MIYVLNYITVINKINNSLYYCIIFICISSLEFRYKFN